MILNKLQRFNKKDLLGRDKFMPDSLDLRIVFVHYLIKTGRIKKCKDIKKQEI